VIDFDCQPVAVFRFHGRPNQKINVRIDSEIIASRKRSNDARIDSAIGQHLQCGAGTSQRARSALSPPLRPALV
jgi:hypothetical protein